MLPHGKETGMWLPDVAVKTASSFRELTTSKNYPVRLHSDGFVEFVPGGLIRFQCKIDLSYFPFDFMPCKARIESWFYSIRYQNFKENSSQLFLYNFSNHEQWTLDSHHTTYHHLYYGTSNDTFSAVDFHVLMKRKTSYYHMNVVMPVIMLSVLECITFLLPSEQPIRIQVSVLLLMAFTMFLAIIQADLPRSSDQIPLLTIYVTLMIVYVSLAISLQCFIMTLITKAKKGCKPPSFLFNCFNRNVEAKYRENQNVLSVDEDRKHQHKEYSNVWKLIYVALNRGSIIFYVVLIVFTSLILLMVVPSTKT